VAKISGLDVHLAQWGRLPLAFAVAATVAIVLAAALCAWLQPSSRIVVVLLVTTGLVLAASPTYFGHYGELMAAPLALTVAVAAQRLVDWGRQRQPTVRMVTMAAVVAPLAALALGASTTTFGTRVSWPDRQKARSIAGCVTADIPTGLIQLDVLTSSLQRSCPVWVDVTGLTYLNDAQRTPAGYAASRLKNQRWQRDLSTYLMSGSATVLLQAPSQVLSPQNVRRLEALPLIARAHRYRIYGR
jgi:hypothetical protein